jgi:hypothetical protein
MPELTIPFWLASTTMEASASIRDWMRSVRVNPRWLDEVVVTTPASTLRFDGLEGCPDSALIYRWQDWQQSQHLLLHNACREIVVGDRRLNLLISEAAATTTAVLLAAPAIIGIYNLSPLAYVEERFSDHLLTAEVDLLAQLETDLKKAERKPSQINSLLIDPGPCKKPIKSKTPFEGASWAKAQPGAEGGLAACHDVLNSLMTSGRKNGLALEVEPDLNLYATWIERI